MSFFRVEKKLRDPWGGQGKKVWDGGGKDKLVGLTGGPRLLALDLVNSETEGEGEEIAIIDVRAMDSALSDLTIIARAFNTSSESKKKISRKQRGDVRRNSVVGWLTHLATATVNLQTTRPDASTAPRPKMTSHPPTAYTPPAICAPDICLATSSYEKP